MRLPKFVTEISPDQETLEAAAQGEEALKADVEAAARQFYVPTATRGLALWEADYSLKNQGTDEARRAAVRTALAGKTCAPWRGANRLRGGRAAGERVPLGTRRLAAWFPIPGGNFLDYPAVGADGGEIDGGTLPPINGVLAALQSGKHGVVPPFGCVIDCSIPRQRLRPYPQQGPAPMQRTGLPEAAPDGVFPGGAGGQGSSIGGGCCSR